MTRKPESLKIFCSISKNSLEDVNRTLLPSLFVQRNCPKLEIFLINYLADNEIAYKDLVKGKNISISILEPDKPLGFGAAHNYAFQKTKPTGNFLIINPDISLEPETISRMLECYSEKTGLVEIRQLPFTHPKDKTLKKPFETNWASGCCLLINSTMFKEVKGFDEKFWMYLEDVDLSWKSWIHGYKVIQNPSAVGYHFTGLYFRYNRNSYNIEDFWSIRNFLYISYKYWGKRGLSKAKKLLSRTDYDANLLQSATDDFYELLKDTPIEQILVPIELRNKIRIFGYNKFSPNPK